jgi:exopolysaccharide production protein ExoZ
MKKIWTIQYLRALAASAVLVHHLAFGNGDWFPVGSFGVDIFFVISGFIMWVMTERRDRTCRKFVVDRVARIVPTYWCVTILSAVGAFIKPWVFAIQRPSLGDIVSSLLFIPRSVPPVVPQGWTLNLEMFFYVAFAATIVLPRMRQIVTLSVALTALAIFGMLAPIGGGFGRTYLNPRLLEFAGGLWLGEFWLRGLFSNKMLGLSAILIGAFAAQIVTQISGLLTGTWIAASLLIVGGALTCEARFKIPKIKVLAVIGDGSYIIYLIHTPIVQIVKAYPALAPQIQVIIAMLVCVTVAVLLLPLERLIVKHTRLKLNQVVELVLAYIRGLRPSSIA